MSKLLQVVVVCAAFAASAMAQEAVMRDGHPAVQCKQTVDGESIWPIEKVVLNDKPAFKIPMRSTYNGKAATVLISADRIAFESQKQQDSFDEIRTIVTAQVYSYSGKPKSLELRYARKRYSLVAQGPNHFMTMCCTMDAFDSCGSLVELALSDFPAAVKRFNELTKRLPPLREAAWREFQPKATAWRALATKPPLNPEADRHWILAENAFKEKDFASAVEHYEAALEIQPMWPTGWFDLAMIYGEQKDYADATDAMKHYLELVPDALNAKSARDQMFIWEDKAKH